MMRTTKLLICLLPSACKTALGFCTVAEHKVEEVGILLSRHIWDVLDISCLKLKEPVTKRLITIDFSCFLTWAKHMFSLHLLAEKIIAMKSKIWNSTHYLQLHVSTCMLKSAFTIVYPRVLQAHISRSVLPIISGKVIL